MSKQYYIIDQYYKFCGLNVLYASYFCHLNLSIFDRVLLKSPMLLCLFISPGNSASFTFIKLKGYVVECLQIYNQHGFLLAFFS